VVEEVEVECVAMEEEVGVELRRWSKWRWNRWWMVERWKGSMWWKKW